MGNRGRFSYTMEKAALDAFTKSLARELAGRNILVNAVAPGFIDTEMVRAIPDAMKDLLLTQVPLGRMGRPEEVAEVVAFLAVSGSYVNGTVLHVNGGLYGVDGIPWRRSWPLCPSSRLRFIDDILDVDGERIVGPTASGRTNISTGGIFRAGR
jgi:hypothetical protein